MEVNPFTLVSSTCNKDGKRAALLSRPYLLIQAASWAVADADAADVELNYIRSLRGVLCT